MSSITKTINEFRPALQFLGVFISCFVIMSLIYGLFIEHFGEMVDPWTMMISKQVAYLLSVIDSPVMAIESVTTRACSLAGQHGVVLSVYEGCNGLNVMILFVSFLIAYRGPMKSFLWFSLIGVIIIHVVNLTRVVLLYYVALLYPSYMYFTHKYLFTAIIYVVVFGLWYLWVSKYNTQPTLAKSNQH